MLSVIELDVERLVEARWKTFQRRIVAADVCMADDAHRNRGRRELASMTFGTSLMTREAWGCRVIRSLVARVAGERTVSLAVVEEF